MWLNLQPARKTNRDDDDVAEGPGSEQAPRSTLNTSGMKRGNSPLSTVGGTPAGVPYMSDSVIALPLGGDSKCR